MSRKKPAPTKTTKDSRTRASVLVNDTTLRLERVKQVATTLRTMFEHFEDSDSDVPVDAKRVWPGLQVIVGNLADECAAISNLVCELHTEATRAGAR